MVSEFKVLFSFFCLKFLSLGFISLIQLSFLLSFSCFKFLARRHSQVDIIFLLLVAVFFPGHLNNFKDDALRNLTFFVKFLPLSFLLEKKKKIPQDLFA